MAENNTHPGWRAEMTPEEHIGTYSAFLTGTKVVGVILVIIMGGMAVFLL